MKCKVFCALIVCTLLYTPLLLAQPPMTTIPKIDGIISPDEWSGAVKYNNFIPVEAGKYCPAKATTAYFGYDRDNIYIAFDCNEPEPDKLKAEFTDRDSTVWTDDCVEIFLKTAINRPEYYHFIVNARGTVMDQFCRPREIGAHKDWNAEGIKTAAGRMANGWQAEISIPLRNFYLCGSEWTFNLGRTAQLPKPEYSSAAGIKASFHHPEYFLHFRHELDAKTFVPGMEIIGAGDRHVGKNTAKLLIRNDNEKTGAQAFIVKVIAANGKISELSNSIQLDGNAEQIVDAPYEAGLPGRMELRIELKEQGKCVFSVSRTINIKAPATNVTQTMTPATSHIDEDLALVIDGKKVFPLIFFRAPPSLYGELKKNGFNCAEVTNYRNNDDVITAYLKSAENAGIGLLPQDDYSARRFLPGRLKKVVEKFKDSPGLWAWYLADEPQNYGISPENAADLYQIIRKADHSHPVFLLGSEPKLYADYVPACDIFGVDCYPVPKQPLKIIADYIESAHKAVKNSKPVWFAVQACGALKNGGRLPTEAELRCMAYLALVHQVKGLLFFAYWSEEMGGSLIKLDPQFYQDVLKIGGEISKLSKALTAPAIRQNFHVKGDNGKLHCRMIADNNDIYLLTVNPHPEKIKAEFILTTLPKSGEIVLASDRADPINAVNGAWHESFNAYDVKIYQIKK